MDEIREEFAVRPTARVAAATLEMLQGHLTEGLEADDFDPAEVVPGLQRISRVADVFQHAIGSLRGESPGRAGSNLADFAEVEAVTSLSSMETMGAQAIQALVPMLREIFPQREPTQRRVNINSRDVRDLTASLRVAREGGLGPDVIGQLEGALYRTLSQLPCDALDADDVEGLPLPPEPRVFFEESGDDS
jgi:hypothetical protein